MVAEPGARDPRELSAEDAVDIDLVPPRVAAPRLRRVLGIAAIILVLLAAGVQRVTGLWAPAVVLFVVAMTPGLVCYYALQRRRVEIDHRVIIKRTLHTRRLNLVAAEQVQLVVRPARITEVALVVAASGTEMVIPLALYGGNGRRELPALGVRRLAEALERSQSAAGQAIAELLHTQARAQAAGAPVRTRPLRRAVDIAQEVSAIRELTLTDDEIRELIASH